jgi:hypothetical protein
MTSRERDILKKLQGEADRDPSVLIQALGPALVEMPISPVVEQLLIRLSRRVREIEEKRGPVRRVDRAKLAPAAQPYQDIIDKLLFRIVGFSDREVEALAARMEQMS